MQENPFTDHIQILQELKELGFPVDNHFSFPSVFLFSASRNFSFYLKYSNLCFNSSLIVSHASFILVRVKAWSYEGKIGKEL